MKKKRGQKFKKTIVNLQTVEKLIDILGVSFFEGLARDLSLVSVYKSFGETYPDNKEIIQPAITKIQKLSDLLNRSC